MSLVEKLFGSFSDRELKKVNPITKQVLALEPKYQAMSDADLQAQTAAFKQQLAEGKTLDDILPDAFAVCREAAWRVLGMKHFPVQVTGGIALHRGDIAEMQTGEGKTLVATLPAYLNALTGEGVHIVTVNDYLAKFQGEWMGNIFRFKGMSVGIIVHDMDNAQRRQAYACDVTYGTNNEMGFDYLRDNMVIRESDMVQRGHAYAIVDEVDSILIDEARTPLIISGQGDKSTELYARADQFVSRLKNEEDYTVAEKEKAVSLTDEGVAKAQSFFKVENIADMENSELYHHILAALKAHALMKRDVDYVVQNGEVIIVDEFTGRLMVGRRYSDGLHQAIEAKEHVKVERESKTLATITFQNYFRMYKKISGMTGTAKTEEEEFEGIYNLDVVQIPTNRPMIRKDMNDVVYTTLKGKYAAIVEEVVKRHESGQPVLVGTVSVEKSELLSKMLGLRGVPHVVLNAKYHEKEAEIVAQAGKKGAVTIATNMAGRGTDILLGGNAEFLAKQKLRLQGYDDAVIEEALGHSDEVSEEVLAAREEYNKWYPGFKKETDAAHVEVIALGGLHIIGTERHESRRIDNQLRGRAGRQGDPGSSQFFISLEDDLMRLFGSDRIAPMIQKLNVDENMPIEYGMLTKQIENAQKRVESRNYAIRKSVLQFDDVMNQQREIIYGQRRQVLMGEDMKKVIADMRETLLTEAVERHCAAEGEWENWNIRALAEELEHLCMKPGSVAAVYEGLKEPTKKQFTEALLREAETFYQEREDMFTQAGIDMREFERVALLGAVDRRWMDHIDAMDQLREGIGLRAYGQRDPVVEFKVEGYNMFEEMVHLMQEDTLRRLCFAVLVRQTPPEQQEKQEREEERKLVASHGGDATAHKAPAKATEKVGRNDPCPCGSGKKYKECCGRGK